MDLLHKIFLISVIVTLLKIESSKGQYYNNITDLQTTLLSSYNTDIRPVINQSDVLNVNLTLAVFKMPMVDSVQGSIIMGLQFFVEWKDELITWNPADYEGTNQTVISASKVFTPKVCLTNSFEFDTLTGDFMSVKYSYDGSAFFTPGAITSLTCNLFVKYWPFDKQVCTVSAYVYGFDSTQISLTRSNPAVITTGFEQNGAWLVDTDSFESQLDNTYYFTQVIYTFEMKRQSLYYVLTILLPIKVLIFLTGVVLFLPNDAGTRSGFTLTIMLSLAVFLGTVADDIPKGSDPVPLFCIYLLLGISFTSIMTVIAVLNARIYVRSTDIPVSKFYKKLVRFSRIRQNQVDNPKGEREMTSYDQEEKGGRKTSHIAIAYEQELKGGRKGPQLVTPSTTHSNDDNDDDNYDNVTWEEVANAIDRLLMIGLIFTAYIPSILWVLFIAVLSHHNH